MSGKRSRDKGKRGELEWSHLCQPLWPNACRGKGQTHKGSDACDVEGTPFWWEVKNTARPNILAAVRQADQDTDGRPIAVATKLAREGWLVTMHACDFFELMGIRYVAE